MPQGNRPSSAQGYKQAEPHANLEERILAHLRQHPAKKAKELAADLDVDKKLINSALYGSLKSRLVQDREYRWSLLESVESESPDAGGEEVQPATPVHRLCRYYLDCIGEGDNDGVSVYATSFNEVDYAFLPGSPSDLGSGDATGLPSEVRRLLAACTGPKSQLAMRIGYPTVYVRRKSKKGSTFGMIQPLLVWTVDPAMFRAGGLPAVLNDPPSVNIEAMASLCGELKNTAMESVLELQRHLGLDQISQEPPELDEIALRLRTSRSEWPWVEWDGEEDGGNERFDALANVAIIDRFVLVTTERSPYTRGLETELSDVARMKEALTEPTALRSWVTGALATQEDGSNPGPILEVLPLNSEQRHAVERAMTRPLTVITGPPGTGKSQVVSAILVNAARSGMRVLFASKNNKAVDVVDERVNGLGPRPFLLRLGASEYLERLKEYITRMLAVSATLEDRREYEESRQALEEIRRNLEELDREREGLIELRNHVDQLEQDAEAFREQLGPELFARSREIKVDRFAALADESSTAFDALDQNRAGILARVTWRWSRPGRLESAKRSAEVLRETCPDVEVELPGADPDERNWPSWVQALADLREQIDAIRIAGDYLRSLAQLSASRSLEAILDVEIKKQDALEEVSARLWDAWLRIQPAELSAEARRLLAEYVSVLQLLVAGQGEEGQASTQVWGRYYKASQEVVSVLSCWAVTSLSAKGRIPLEPGIFDLLVIDEASQCDIASAIPLLFRAKRVVIIGDPNQLKHISSLGRARDQQLLEKHDLVGSNLNWSYSVNSLFDLASGLCKGEDLVMLRDHHRSHPHIIGFSNDEFYEGRLRVATRLSALRTLDPAGPVVRWIQVRGNCVRPAGGGLRNEAEAARVVAEVRRILVEQKYKGSIGVIAPFRDQVNIIRDLISQDSQISERLDSSDLLVETVHRFQGDERDLMIFSPTISSGPIDHAAGFLRSTANLFNVAITRARAALVVVGDAEAARSAGVGHLDRFAKYVSGLDHAPGKGAQTATDLGPEYPPVSNPHQVSDWERVLYRALYRSGLRPIPQYTEEKYILDLALIDGERRLDIEVDGERYHRAWDGELCRRDRLRDLRLVELGWDVQRFWVYQVRDDLEACVRRVSEWKTSAGRLLR